jgi:beta-N-acetylhexosaminidase
VSPLYFGLSGPTLTADERVLFQACAPAGFILFARNCVDAEQIRALTDDLRALAGRDDLPILIDQEGGRVARLGPPHWPAYPPQACFAELYAVDPQAAVTAAQLNARLIGLDLRAVGVSVDCLPLLDVVQPGAHDIIGDRAYGSDPTVVGVLGRAVLDGLAEAGIVGVVKHIPGHGRAQADSHIELPVVRASHVDLLTDLAPFVALKDAPMAMTAHVIYTAWDDDRCASVSSQVIARIIRGQIGFQGLLMSDDLGMQALKGDMRQRAQDVLSAGCDIALHCSGDFAEMSEIADAVPNITADALQRQQRAMRVATPVPGDSAALRAERDRLLAMA